MESVSKIERHASKSGQPRQFARATRESLKFSFNNFAYYDQLVTMATRRNKAGVWIHVHLLPGMAVEHPPHSLVVSVTAKICPSLLILGATTSFRLLIMFYPRRTRQRKRKPKPRPLPQLPNSSSLVLFPGLNSYGRQSLCSHV
jgi:hypothetical protein